MRNKADHVYLREKETSLHTPKDSFLGISEAYPKKWMTLDSA